MSAVSDDDLQKKENETIERAELLYEYQCSQFELSLASIRRLEDKASKMMGFLTVIITTSLLIVRYWWGDIFTGGYTPIRALCWGSLALFLLFSAIAWGFSLSAMQVAEFERPSSSLQLTDFFIKNKRYQSLVEAANCYSGVTSKTDEAHNIKVDLIGKSFESIVLGAWSFIAFILFFLTLKLTI
ncbi:hypothetical protein ABT208_000537 [Escherichia coli]